MIKIGSDENFPGVIKPANAQGDLKPGVGNFTTAVGNNRRALSAINRNIVGAPPYPCAVHKRGILTEKNEASSKKCVGPVHRPVTRKFAAELSGQKQHLSVEESRSDEDKNVDDLDDVPMFVQHTEAMLEEIDRMDAEIEMEDVDDDEVLVEDIDSCDKINPLAVTEYIGDLYNYYKKMESLSCVPPNYMHNQSDLNERMRGILVDWLIEVHYKFELMDETLYLTLNLIDRFLALQPVVRKKLQLVGVTALLLACKYEEVSVPVVEDLVLISDRAYCKKEVLEMVVQIDHICCKRIQKLKIMKCFKTLGVMLQEKLMLNALQFNMSLPTPYVFMKRFLKAAQSDEKLDMLSFFLIELCLVEYEMLCFQPSLLAAAAVFTAQCSLSGYKKWSKTSEMHTGYTQDQLMECAKLMVSFHQKAGTGKLTGVHKKYSTSKYGYAARVEPAVFLLVDVEH